MEKLQSVWLWLNEQPELELHTSFGLKGPDSSRLEFCSDMTNITPVCNHVSRNTEESSAVAQRLFNPVRIRLMVLSIPLCSSTSAHFFPQRPFTSFSSIGDAAACITPLRNKEKMFSYYQEHAEDATTHCLQSEQSLHSVGAGTQCAAPIRRWSTSPWNRVWGRVAKYHARLDPPAASSSPRRTQRAASDFASPSPPRRPVTSSQPSPAARAASSPTRRRSPPPRSPRIPDADRPGAADWDGEFVYTRDLLDPAGGTRVQPSPPPPPPPSRTALARSAPRRASGHG